MAKRSALVRRCRGQALKVDYDLMPIGLKLAAARWGDGALQPSFLMAHYAHGARHLSPAPIRHVGVSPRREAMQALVLCLTEAVETVEDLPRFFADTRGDATGHRTTRHGGDERLHLTLATSGPGPAKRFGMSARPLQNWGIEQEMPRSHGLATFLRAIGALR